MNHAGTQQQTGRNINALGNMVWYVLAIVVEFWIAFGLALLLNAEIRARKFWRVAFLLPLMLSPVAVSWMIGKSMLETRFGPVARFARDWLGWDTPTFFADRQPGTLASRITATSTREALLLRSIVSFVMRPASMLTGI